MSAFNPSSFGSHARDYDTFRTIQVQSARQLAQRVGELTFNDVPEVLDLGCGTGGLTGELLALPAFARARITGFDRFRQMLEVAQEKFPQILPREGDFNQPDFLGEERFDLIASSFALQWALDPAAVLNYLAHHLTQGGTLAVALPLQGSLWQLKSAFKQSGSDSFINEFPKLDDLLRPLKSCSCLEVSADSGMCCLYMSSCRQILRSITKIGGGSRMPSPDGTAAHLSASMLRALYDNYEQYRHDEKSYEISYNVGYILARRIG